jgi:hypothetical protein
VVHADDSIEISHATMSIWDVEDQEPISGMSLEGCDRIEATKKWGETGLIHWPYRVEELQGTSCSSALVEADSRDRPQKIKYKFLMSSILHSYSHYRTVRFDSRPYSSCKDLKDNERHRAADLDDRPKSFLPSSLSIYSVDLTDDGKLGYGFTSADELEEVDIGPGDKPRPTFVSKKLHPCFVRADDSFIKRICRLLCLGLYREAWVG